MKKLFSHWKEDIPASLVVYLVALPLCLGISLASTGDSSHLFSGIIAGVVGGVIVGFFSGSRLGVSGPAAGLITIVSAAIISIGSFEGFLVAVIISGLLQIVAGLLKAGAIGQYFPSSVIKGMLAAIGITLILKEIPHALGYDANFMGDESFLQPDNHNTFSQLIYAIKAISPGAFLTTIISIIILVLFEKPFLRKIALFKILPGALFVVVLGILITIVSSWYFPQFSPSADHLVSLPINKNGFDITTLFVFPDFSVLTNSKVYVIGLTIALIGSIETLLSVEAADKLDPEKFKTPKNKELIAQGIGNIVSGLIGGLPVTQVIVRSSANISSGGKSKLSTMFHGVLLILTAVFIPNVLNLIPLASLSAILLMVGYKLSKLDLYKQMFKLGVEQYLPFIVTILGVLLTDLLKGIMFGVAISIFFILRKNYRNNFTEAIIHEDDHDTIAVILSEEVSFINKGSILTMLNKLPPNAYVIIDGAKCKSIDYDVLEIIQEFKNFGASEKCIKLELKDIPSVKIVHSH